MSATSFEKDDLITHPNNPGLVVWVISPNRGKIMGIMGWQVVEIMDDPGWIKLEKGDPESHFPK